MTDVQPHVDLEELGTPRVDYRLLARFEASRRRLEAARQALPPHWQADPRPEAQIINEHWVAVMAQAMDIRSRRAAHRPSRRSRYRSRLHW